MEVIGKKEETESNASSYQVFEMKCNPSLSFKYKVDKK